LKGPREKALRFGVDALSTRELLAILLRTGAKENLFWKWWTGCWSDQKEQQD